MKSVGILGAGQLGCMLSESLQSLGAKVYFFDPSPLAPGRYRTPYFFQGSWLDQEKLHEFFTACDVVTYEFENVDPHFLKSLSQTSGTPIFPSVEVLEITQSRRNEKAFLLEQNLPLAPFRVINNWKELATLRGKITAPMIAKTLSGGYDGKGQMSINNDTDLEKAQVLLPLVLESRLNIFCEASVITARNALGNSCQFPIFENTHKDHILSTSIVPSFSISPEIGEVLLKLAQHACDNIAGGLVGMLTTEFFICREEPMTSILQGKLLKVGEFFVGINEFAPRTHNSGHVTRKACSYSQFDILARILLDLPLPQSIELSNKASFYGMANILGDTWLKQATNANPDFSETLVTNADKNLNLSLLAQYPQILETYLYAKKEAKKSRKMGHFIGVGSSAQEVLNNLAVFKNELESLKLKNCKRATQA